MFGETCLERAAGHLSGLALSGLQQVGRGFAAQQLIEEWNARRALSAKARYGHSSHRVRMIDLLACSRAL